MNFITNPLILVTFFPLVGVLALLFIPADKKNVLRWTTLVASLLTFGLSIWMLTMFNKSNPDLQLGFSLPWIQVAGWNISFAMGVDGLSILLVLLTTFLTPIAILSTWTAVEERVKDFMIFFTLLEMGMLGVFLAQDLFLFYIFWEFTLVPMYFLIGIWGGPRRIYAAIKFFLYTMAGSILMLLAILWLGIYQGTFSVPELITKGGIPGNVQLWLFLAFAAAFAIKVPMWPLHSWLPDAHVEAPTAGSVILAGVLLKMGTYGFLRFNLPMFPEAALKAAPWMALLAVIGIIYGAAVSYAQKDIKKLVAYSSVSHLGFVMLGLFALNAQGIEGGQVISQPALHMSHHMHDMGITLHIHQVADAHRAWLTDPPDVIAAQIHQHNVLGPFLLVTLEFLFQAVILGGCFSPRPGPGQGTGHDHAILYPYQNLR